MAGLPEGLEESPGHGSIHTSVMAHPGDIPGLSTKSTGPQNNLDETVTTCQTTMVC